MTPRNQALLTAFALVCLLASPLHAGEIRGRTADTLGGGLGIAAVAIENVATGETITPALYAAGDWSVPNLKAGTYRLTATAAGFSAATRLVVLESEGALAEVSLTLPLGNLSSEVTVTASRNSRDSLILPLRAESLGQSVIATANPASVGDLLTEAPGVTPVGNGPFQTRPRLRGLDSTRVLVLVDGERLNNARTATDRAGVEVGLVDASTVESVEVASGVGSVLYGTDALSGTVNILTHQPRFTDTRRFTLGGNGYYSSNESGRRGTVSLGLSAPRYAFSLSGGRESFDNYRSGGRDGDVLEDSRPYFASGVLKQVDTIDTNFGFRFKAFPEDFNTPFVRTSTQIASSFFNGSSLNANGVVALDDRQEVRVKFLRREAKDAGFPDFATPQFFQGIVLPYSKLDKASVRYEIRNLAPWFSRLSATAYTQTQDRLLRNVNIPVQFPVPSASFFPISVFRLVINRDTGQKVDTRGLDVQGTFLASPRNLLTAGLTYYQDDSADYRTSTTQTNLVGQVVMGARGPAAVVFPSLVPLGGPSVTHPTRVPDARFRNLAAFAQDEWDVTSRLRLVAGLRVDGYRVATDATSGYDIASVVAGATPAIDPATLPNPGGDAISRTALTGDLGLVYRTSDNLSFFARYGRSYRHPNLEELLFAGPATIGTIAPNVKVGPEKGNNVDLGMKFRASHVQGSVSYFHNRYSDFISTEITALTASSSVSQAVNFADVRIQGLEADLQASWNQGPALVSLYANGAYNRGDVLSGANPLTRASIAGTPQDNISPLKLVAGLHLSDRHDRVWAEYSVRHQKKVDRLAATVKDSPYLIYQDLAGLNGFTVHRIGAGYDWRRGQKTLGLTATVENLTNLFYREQFQFAPARGRTFTFGLRVRGL